MLSGVFNQAMTRIFGRTGPVRLIIAAVSGGMDSVVLAHLLARWRDGAPNPPAILVAHLNHGIRAEDAGRDMELCRDIAGKLAVPFIAESVDVPEQARLMQLGLEETGRMLRHRFFHRLSRERADGDAIVVTGHHADDQAETILLHLRRGAHRRGLSGMREITRLPVPPDGVLALARPLLAVGRDALRPYALAHKLVWREDATNQDTDYARNHIRHRIIPMLEAVLPGFRQRLLAKAATLSAEEEALSRHGVELALRASRRENGGRFFQLDEDALSSPERLAYALRHVLEEEMGARLPYGAVLSRIEELAERGRLGEAVALPGRLVARREHDGLFFFFPETVSGGGEEIILPDPPFAIAAAGLSVAAEWRFAESGIPESDRLDPHVEWLNPAAIRWPLRLRRPAPGERFRPLGAPGGRKIQDILVDVKSPRRKRAMARVVADYAGGVWLWPYRLANRVALADGFNKALRMEIREHNG